MAKWSAERQGEFINNLTKGPLGIIENWKLVLTWKKSQKEQEEELARQQTIFEQNQAITRAQQQIETYKQMADDKIAIAEEMRDAEIQAQKDTNETIANELDVLDTKRRQKRKSCNGNKDKCTIRSIHSNYLSQQDVYTIEFEQMPMN